MLPPLREELTLYAGAPAADGSPTWSLHDPARNLFFRIDWLTFEIVARWSLSRAEVIADAVANQTTLQVEPEDVEQVRKFVTDNQLCQAHDATATASLVTRDRSSQSGALHWLLHHYLFFRVALWRPDRWLARHLSRVSFFYSRTFFRLTAAAFVLGTFECARQWATFSSTLVEKLSLHGALGYAGALIFVKGLHELGHAFTAKRKGCRVPTMGIAFLVMWPVAYTDVNEVWKLPKSMDRFAVGAAGIVTELIVAAWATLAWAVLPDGTLRDAAFLLATTTWISTLVINASPFMRFDGYFLLSDLLDIPNLHARAFALARWDLRERLFALGEPVPEVWPRARHRGLIVFAWLVWIYRLVLFLGIAALVYHFFIKLLGIVLFAVEIGYFVLLPIWREAAEWRRRAEAIRASSRFKRSALLLGVVLLAGWAPWNTHVHGDGVLRTARHFALYAPGASRVVSLPQGNGAHVEAGERLLMLESPDLEFREARAREHARRLEWELAVSGFDDAMRATQSVRREELASSRTEIAGLQRERQRLQVQAPFDGVLVDVPPAIAPGVWVNRQEQLGELIDPSEWQVETYLEDNEVRRVKVGDLARFYPEAAGRSAVRLRVTRIDIDATRQLSEPMLAIQHGGPIVARERNEQLVPEKALYRVMLKVERAPDASAGLAASQRGRVVISGARKSWFAEYLRSAFNVVIRESGW
jgi:putative peptide zinc metalloprotease protein